MKKRFSRIQNLHISQTSQRTVKSTKQFSRIQNLHISQTRLLGFHSQCKFSRIQNLHISQTVLATGKISFNLVEFKIYISLKPQIEIRNRNFEFGYKKMDRHRSRPEGNLDKIFI